MLAGAVHALSFAPGPLPAWALPFIQLLCFAYLADNAFQAASVKQAAWRGLVFGCASFTLGLYWLFISMNQYGGMPAPAAALGVLALAMAMAVYGALALALTRWLRPPGHTTGGKPAMLMLTSAVFASAWTLFEWLRGTLFTGFPWLNTGYAHVDGMFSRWAPLLGVYGVAWFAAFLACALALYARARKNGTDGHAAVVLALGIVFGIAGLGLSRIHWGTPVGDTVIVRLVQGNVPQSQKFDPALLQQGIETYLHLAGLPPKAPDGKPDIIILPETVVPLFQNRVSAELWQRWINVARDRNATLIMGVPLNTASAGRQAYTNSVIGINADTPLQNILAGTTQWRYDKHHLVPFGEFVPSGFRWFVDMMSIPLGDFDRGTLDQEPFAIAGQRIAMNICYEDVFGEEIAAALSDHHGPREGATVLVNVSNLAWFGDSWALRQHLQIARMRAMETARPMLRSTNTGTTAAIDPNGSVRAALPQGRPGVMAVEIQGTTGLTPYVRWGNNPIILFCTLILGLALGQRRQLAARSSP
jgi:apolipoprotein N-acyltransferase